MTCSVVRVACGVFCPAHSASNSSIDNVRAADGCIDRIPFREQTVNVTASTKAPVVAGLTDLRSGPTRLTRAGFVALRRLCFASWLRFPGTTWLRHFADPRVPGEHELAGMECGLLKIRSIGRKHLPSSYLFAQHSNRSHVGKFGAQRFVVLLCRRQPHSVVCRWVRLFAQDKDDLVFHIDGQRSV